MKEEKNKRIFRNSGIKIFLFLFMFTITGFFTNSVFADDKGETKDESAYIRVLIVNNGPPGHSGQSSDHNNYVCKDSRALNFSNTGKHKQSLCIYLKENEELEDVVEKDDGDRKTQFEENKNLKLDDGKKGGFVIKRKKDSDFKKDEEIIFNYEKKAVSLFLKNKTQENYAGQRSNLNLEISTKSKEFIDLKSNIIDAYLIIRDKNGNILRKEDLYDSERGIDVLGLKNLNKINLDTKSFLNHDFVLENGPGKYFVEVGLILSPRFLNLDNVFNKDYLIEIHSNQIEVNLLPENIDNKNRSDNSEFRKIIENLFNTKAKKIIVFSAGLTLSGFWWLIIFLRRRLVRLVTNFVLDNKNLISALESKHPETLEQLIEYINPKMLSLVTKEKILKVLESVLKK